MGPDGNSLTHVRMPANVPEFVVIGKVLRPHGVRGELRLMPLTENPERFRRLTTVFLNRDGGRRPFPITGVKLSPTAVLISLQGIATRTEAENWQGSLVEIEAKDIQPLAEGELYYFEVIGMAVESESGQKLGTVTDVLSYPAQDLYVVESAGREILIPAVPAIVQRVDTEQRLMVIHALEGLLDL
ncbi:MAG TPA: ribosome maturation factor RimM [bacterium]|nr:ribosome maturation factor RimM [bacterium]HPN35709.1 ribosome maturation factor RimM [bacterium]